MAFGDSTSSTQTAPVKAYSAYGTYCVFFKAYQDDCYDAGTGTGIPPLPDRL